MDLKHTFESLKYQFNEADYTRKRDINLIRYKALPQKKMKDQTHDYAIIEYDGKDPVYSLWFASYMSENNFPVDRVEEIRLIGEPGKDSLEKLQNAFPKAKIAVINKEIKELEFEDLYCEHTLVFHFFGDLFLKEKAYETEISIKNPNFPMQDTVLTTVPRRYNLEKLAKLIRDTRFIYNIFAYNCDGDDMDWQMLNISFILNPDTFMYIGHTETYVCGNLCIDSFSWNEDDFSIHFDLKIAFENRKFNPAIDCFYTEDMTGKQGETKSQGSVWNKAVELWENEHYNQAVCLFEKLSEEKGDKLKIDGKSLCQMAIKNLIKIYSEGKPEAGIEKNYTKVQKLLEKVNYNENKEVIAVCLENFFLTTAFFRKKHDVVQEPGDSITFAIIKELYDSNIHEPNYTYNMATCYASGIGCEKNYEKAIDICDKYLNEHDDNEIKRLKAYILLKSGNNQAFTEIIENLEVAEFKDKVNATKTYEGEELKKRMLELENLPGCVKCSSVRKYNEKLRVCPNVLGCIGVAYIREGDKEKANAYFERSAEFGDASACFLVAQYCRKNGDIAKAISMYRKAMYYGHRRSLVFLHDYEKNIVAKLHYLLLLEGSNYMEDGKIQYLVYQILSHRCISVDKGDESVWLLKSSDNEYADAVITYIDELIDEGDEYAALEYLRKYKGDDDNVKKKLAELEEYFEDDEDFEDDEELDEGEEYDEYDDYYDDNEDYQGGGYEWTDEDAWDAMTDGQYGDYPGPGWDPERFGY